VTLEVRLNAPERQESMTHSATDHHVTPETAIHIRSIHTTRWLWIDQAVYKRYGAQLGPVGLGVYVGLASYANNKTAKCWPSMTRLAADMGTDLTTIDAALERIIAVGLLHVTQEPGKGTVLTLLDAHAAVPIPPPVASPAEERAEPAPADEPPVILARASEELNPELNINKNKSSSGLLGNKMREPSPVVLRDGRGQEHKPDASWNQGPVQLPDPDRPDEFLASLGLRPGEEDYESLYAVAEAEIKAEGHNPFYTITPIKQARMIQILLRNGVSPYYLSILAAQQAGKLPPVLEDDPPLC
jgi:hypothetical protein